MPDRTPVADERATDDTTATGDVPDDGAAGRRRRGRVLLAVGALVIGAYAIIAFVGTQQAGREVERIEAATRTNRVDTTATLAFMYGSAPNPIAEALDVPDTAVAVLGTSPGWCAAVKFRRLVAERVVFVSVSEDGAMRRVKSCVP